MGRLIYIVAIVLLENYKCGAAAIDKILDKTLPGQIIPVDLASVKMKTVSINIPFIDPRDSNSFHQHSRKKRGIQLSRAISANTAPKSTKISGGSQRSSIDFSESSRSGNPSRRSSFVSLNPNQRSTFDFGSSNRRTSLSSSFSAGSGQRRHSLYSSRIPKGFERASGGGLETKWRTSKTFAPTNTAAAGGQKFSSLFSSLFSGSSPARKNSLTLAEKSFRDNPAKFLNRNALSTKHVETSASQAFNIPKGGGSLLKSGQVYNFGLQKVPGRETKLPGKEQYLLTVKKPGEKGVKATWLNSRDTISVDNKGPKMVLTSELGGCTIFAGCDSKTKRLNVFHHFRQFNSKDPVKTTEGIDPKGHAIHRVFHPTIPLIASNNKPGSHATYSKALKYERYDKTKADKLPSAATSLLYRDRKGNWNMGYQNLNYLDNRELNNFPSGAFVNSKIPVNKKP